MQEQPVVKPLILEFAKFQTERQHVLSKVSIKKSLCMNNWYIFLRPYLPLILINKLLLGAELWNVEVDCCEANYLSGFSFKVAKSNLFFYFQRARPMMLAF